MSALLRDWKGERSALLHRYDTDRDGDIDVHEWQRAVAEAEREVDAQHRDARRNPGLHMLRAPNDGRPFLLSNRPSDELRKRYNQWAWFYLAVFIAVSTWGLVSLFGRSQ